MGTTVVIVGAGFAGLAAARVLGNYAAGRPEVSVILLDRHPFTTMVPSLPDLAGGRFDRARLTGPIAAQIPPSVDFRRETVAALDFNRREVVTDNGTIRYDHLILAAGSVNDFHGFNQRLDAIHWLDFLEDADRLFADFTAYARPSAAPHVLIAGGGYTGLELAASLQDAARRLGKPARVTVVEFNRSLLPAMPDWVRAYMMRQCERRGLDIVTGATVVSFDGRTASLSNGATLENVFLCWATGTKFPIAALSGNHRQERDGRFEIDPCLRLPAHPDVWAAGDAAAIRWNGGLLRKAVNFSRDSGRHAGLNIIRTLRGEPPVPFKPVDLGWVIPFGDVGVGVLFNRFGVKGRLPLALHYAMCGLRNYSAGNVLFYWKKAVTAFFTGS